MECVDFVIGERLKAALILRKVKQKELASHLGVTDNTISYYCSGKRTPNVQQIAEISKYLGVSADYLLGLSNTPTTDADLSKAVQLAKEMRENVVFTPTVFGGGDTVIVTKEVWLMIADAVEGKI